MSKVVRDFIGKTKITKDGAVIPGKAEQAKLRDAILAILEQAADEGHRIASQGAEKRAISLGGKGFLARAGEIASGIVAMIKEKAQSFLDAIFVSNEDITADEAVTEAEVQLEEWAADYSEVIGMTEIVDAIEETVLDDFVEQGVAVVSWVAEDGACAFCQENVDASPLVISSPFPTGDYHPPAHPRCRCHLERDVILKDSNDTL